MERILPEPPVQSRRPAVSVVMPVYNGDPYLRDAVESILAQSLTDLELVVVDDGSTDRTPEILEELAARDSRIALHRQANQGSVAALNAGIAAASGELIARLDADDVALPDRLEHQLGFLREHPEVAMVGGQVRIIDGSGRAVADARYPTGDAEIRGAFERSTPFVHSAVTMRRTALERAGGYRPEFNLAEDLDLWLRIAEVGAVANLDRLVVEYRIHENQVSAQKLEQQAICSLAARDAARRRAAGGPDPYAAAGNIDEALLRAQGVTREQIDGELVAAATWMAKTLDRAGHRAAARELFATAGRRARSGSDPGALIATVRRAQAARHLEQGHRLRARGMRMRAALAERTAR
jgi:glycosyltransferase involved in cell wall biosynthesis